MLPRLPPPSIAKLDKGDGAEWITQVRNHIVLNGFDAVLAPVRRPPASWLDMPAPSTPYPEVEVASAITDSTPPPHSLSTWVSRPSLDYAVEELLLNLL